MSEENNFVDNNTIGVSLEEEMKRSYLDYAMSVIVSRALPDVRDGLKPVHRRILYGMHEGGCDFNKPYRKSARIVGDVMGKYHPHGDSPIYESMVRMAQPFAMRTVLVDGQGNFGSMDGDSAAAMRYTEARLAKIAHKLLEDIGNNTVDFQPNYDESTIEPKVLPASFPNLLVNGASGIAVGMATNIPTHNLGEIIQACIILIDNPTADIQDIIKVMPGPDFPTGGIILGQNGILSAFKTGRGSLLIRSRCTIEETKKDKFAIIVTEIPYQVNKARLIEKIAEVVNNGIVEGISDLRDESDKDGVRIVIDLKRDAVPDVVLNQLYRHTTLQTSFGVNMLALYNGMPKLMDIVYILRAFIAFRVEVVIRRCKFELEKIRDRAHILIGLAIAVENIDEIIIMIKTSPDASTAKSRLLSMVWNSNEVAPLIALVDDPHNIVENGTCKLTETQAQAILDLKLQRLTALEREKISNELKELSSKIKDLLEILSSQSRVLEIVRSELQEIGREFSTPRKTSIEQSDASIEDEDLIQREDMVVTVSNSGYIKRVPLSSYKAQKRGGKGKTGMTTRDEDFVHDLFVASTHTIILFFSTSGIVYQMKVYKLPLATPASRGKAIINLLPISSGETISTVMALPEDKTSWEDLSVVFATSNGTIRRNKLTDFINIKSGGKIAMKLDNGEKLIAVAVCNNNSDILISSKMGKCVRFSVSDLRVFSGRTSTGVRSIKLLGDDEVISMSILYSGKSTPEEREQYVKYANFIRRSSEEILSEGQPDAPKNYEEMKKYEQMLLTITEKGYGKRTSSYEYRTTSRGAQGVKNIEISSKNGNVIAVLPVEDNDDIMLVTDSGKLIRCNVKDIRITSRGAQGVIVFRIDKNEKVVNAVRLLEKDDSVDINENC